MMMSSSQNPHCLPGEHLVLDLIGCALTPQKIGQWINETISLFGLPLAANRLFTGAFCQPGGASAQNALAVVYEHDQFSVNVHFALSTCQVYVDVFSEVGLPGLQIRQLCQRFFQPACIHSSEAGCPGQLPQAA
jgi:hypothetical protein